MTRSARRRAPRRAPGAPRSCDRACRSRCRSGKGCTRAGRRSARRGAGAWCAGSRPKARARASRRSRAAFPGARRYARRKTRPCPRLRRSAACARRFPRPAPPTTRSSRRCRTRAGSPGTRYPSRPPPLLTANCKIDVGPLQGSSCRLIRSARLFSSCFSSASASVSCGWCGGRTRRRSSASRARAAAPRESSLDPAVEPVHFPEGLRGALREQVVAQVARRPAAVDDVPEDPRSDRHPRGAQVALLFVGEERGVDLAAGLLELAREHHRVLDRHARALCEVLHGRMRRVAEQGHVAARPAGPRLAVVQHPVLVLADVAEHLLHLRRGVRERFGELVGPAVVAPLAALEALTRDGGDVVHDRAPAQAVLHEMQVGADPDDHVVEMRAVLDLVEGHYPAVADVADRARRAVADQDLAHARAQAVGAYHGRALVFRPVGEAREHPAGRFAEALKLLRGMQGDLLALPAGLQQRAVKVAAVHDGVGRAEVPAELRPAGDARELAVGERIDEDQVPGEYRLRLQVLHHSQPVEHAVGVGPLLDAVADLAELGRLLEDLRAHAAAGERERGRDAADAAADDEDFRRSFCLRHLWFPAGEDPGPSAGSAAGNVPTRMRFYIPAPRRRARRGVRMDAMHSYDHGSASFAWRASSFRGPSDYVLELGPQDREEMLAALGALEKNRRLSPAHALARDDFRFGRLAAKLERAYAEVRSGKGFVVLRRLPVEGFALEQFTAAVWGVGLHFGRALSQNAQGELITGVVDATAEDATPRLYRSNLELRPHSDITAMISLACWNKSQSGGASIIVSGVSVHDAIRERAPELLEPLYRGFHYHRLGEEGPGEEPATPYH